MESEGITPAKFADVIGVQRSSISHILNGRNKPSYDFIIKILERFQGINAEWLLTGKGSMIKSSLSSNIPNIRQGSLFDQPTKSEEKTNIKQEKIVFDNQNPIDNNEKVVKDELAEKSVASHSIKGLLSQVTDVNNINHIVIFFDDSTFKQYLPR